MYLNGFMFTFWYNNLGESLVPEDESPFCVSEASEVVEIYRA